MDKPDPDCKLCLGFGWHHNGPKTTACSCWNGVPYTGSYHEVADMYKNLLTRRIETYKDSQKHQEELYYAKRALQEFEEIEHRVTKYQST